VQDALIASIWKKLRTGAVATPGAVLMSVGRVVLLTSDARPPRRVGVGLARRKCLLNLLRDTLQPSFRPLCSLLVTPQLLLKPCNIVLCDSKLH